jgi:hypothetical protein
MVKAINAKLNACKKLLLLLGLTLLICLIVMESKIHMSAKKKIPVRKKAALDKYFSNGLKDYYDSIQ